MTGAECLLQRVEARLRAVETWEDLGPRLAAPVRAVLTQMTSSLVALVVALLQLALVPVLNIALALREVLGGGGVLPPAGQILTIFASTAILATLALAFCARFFDKEKVLFRS